MKSVTIETRAPKDFFRGTLEKYLEALIELKGHAWCMDVQDERKKMARLTAGVLANAAVIYNVGEMSS